MKSAVARILRDLEVHGGLKGSDVANIVNASRPTVSRWKNGKASPPLATQTIIADLRYVVDRLSDFYTPAETRLWLHAKHPLLDNERAIDLILAEPREVIHDRISAGIRLCTFATVIQNRVPLLQTSWMQCFGDETLRKNAIDAVIAHPFEMPHDGLLVLRAVDLGGATIG